MRGVFLCALIAALAACSTADGMTTKQNEAPVEGWRNAVGQTPTRAEFAAVYAACQDRAKSRGSGVFEGCLADLGLHRVQ